MSFRKLATEDGTRKVRFGEKDQNEIPEPANLSLHACMQATCMHICITSAFLQLTVTLSISSGFKDTLPRTGRECCMPTMIGIP